MNLPPTDTTSYPPVRSNIGMPVKGRIGFSEASSNIDIGYSSNATDNPCLYNLIEINNLLTEIKSLLQDDDYDDDFLKPTDYAVVKTNELLLDLAVSSFRLPIKGSISTDGSGGIRVEWTKKNKEVRLIINASQDGQSYIYYENGSLYQAEKVVSGETLLKILKWLEK